MLRAFVCMFRGHRDRWVRNLSKYDSAPLHEVSVWACAMCGREIRMAGWQHPAPPPAKPTPVADMHVAPGTPTLPEDGSSDVTVA